VILLVAMEFYRRSKDVSADMSEMDTEMKPLETSSDQKLLGTDDNENKASAVTSTDSKESSYSWRRLLTDSELRLPLLIACMLVVTQQFSGINAVRITADRCLISDDYFSSSSSSRKYRPIVGPSVSSFIYAYGSIKYAVCIECNNYFIERVVTVWKYVHKWQF
jgi:Sugar (and other) transporter